MMPTQVAELAKSFARHSYEVNDAASLGESLYGAPFASRRRDESVSEGLVASYTTSIIATPLLITCFLVAFGLSGRVAAEQPSLDFKAMVLPVPASAKFVDPNYYICGGSMARGADGKCHLLYSRWPRELGHNAWVTHSEIAHAVADDPLGPYTHVDVALPPRGSQYWDGMCTHNPTVHEFDGKYKLYYMGNFGDGNATAKLNPIHRNNQRIGVAVADNLGDGVPKVLFCAAEESKEKTHSFNVHIPLKSAISSNLD